VSARPPAGLLADLEVAVRAALAGDAAHAQELAYAVGRAALEHNAGVVELAASLRAAVQREAAGGLAPDRLQAALSLMAEVLAPYEMALRGHRDANAELRRMTNALEAKVEQRGHELAQAEVRFRALVEHVPAVIYVAPSSLPLWMTYVSPQIQPLLGFTQAEWLAGPDLWEQQMEPADKGRVLEQWAQAAATGAPLTLEYRMRSRSGAAAWVRDESRRQQDGTRLGIWQDVSERRDLESQLRQSQKMEAVGQLAGGVAHDFNNLITVMLNFGHFVQEDLGPDHPSAADLEEVLMAAERASALTRQLLALSRRHVFQPQKMDLNEVVGGMERMLHRLIGEDVDLKVVAHARAPWVFADRGSLEQVLLNLVVNGREAMPEGGKLTVETQEVDLDEVVGLLKAPPGRYVMLAVTDTGVGMGPGTQARIFEPFFTTKGEGRGTGLGLSTVHQIVRQAKGDLQLYSAPGRGTTFRVYFPRAEEAAAQERASPPSAHELTGTETLLVAEDEQSVRAALVRALSAAGYTVLEADAPEEALEVSRGYSGRISLLVTDVVMPQMSGAVLADILVKERPGMPVLYLSGYTGGALVHQGLFQSGAAYLQKPFTGEALLLAVRKALDGVKR